MGVLDKFHKGKGDGDEEILIEGYNKEGGASKRESLPIEKERFGDEEEILLMSTSEMEEEIDDFLESGTLPTEMIERLRRELISAESDEDIVELHRKVKRIGRERVSLHDSILFSEDLDKNDALDKEIEKIIKKNDLIGKGTVAVVLRVNGSCIKLIYNPDLYIKQNKILEEMDLQYQFHALSMELEGIVKVPTPFFCRNTKMGPVISMETITGFTLREVLEGNKIDILREAGFDEGVFFDRLRSFVEIANEKGLYHRDLHSGNVMIQVEDLNTPVIIDFGTAKKGGLSGESVYRESVVSLGKNVDVFYTSDQESLSRIKEELTNLN